MKYICNNYYPLPENISAVMELFYEKGKLSKKLYFADKSVL